VNNAFRVKDMSHHRQCSRRGKSCSAGAVRQSHVNSHGCGNDPRRLYAKKKSRIRNDEQKADDDAPKN